VREVKTYRETMREMERLYLRCVLAESGSVKEAAAKAGVSRQHFHKLMRRAGMRHSVSHTNRGNAAWQSLQ
jgi:DNA-binding NtrC family response regulator